MHQIKGCIDLLQRHRMRDQIINRIEGADPQQSLDLRPCPTTNKINRLIHNEFHVNRAAQESKRIALSVEGWRMLMCSLSPSKVTRLRFPHRCTSVNNDMIRDADGEGFKGRQVVRKCSDLRSRVGGGSSNVIEEGVP